MHVFVTGGSGYAGTHLIAALVREGHRVTTLVRGQTAYKPPKGVHVLFGDLNDPNTLARVRAPLEVDAIFHLVSAFLEPPGASITVQSTENLVDYYRFAPVPQIIYFSNNIVYGDTSGFLATEGRECRPHTEHGRNKLAAEKVIQASGIPYTILRGTQFYGSDPRWNNSSFDWIVVNRIIEGGLPLVGGGKGQRVGMVHIADVVQAALRSLHNYSAANEVFNICSGDTSVTNREVFHLIADEAGVKRPQEIPRRAAIAYAAVTERLAALRGVEPSIMVDMIRVLFCDRVVSIDKARETLGYDPIYPDTLAGLRSAYAEIFTRGGTEATSRWSEVRG
jgi:UDP-glucose 4-epimerase